MKKLADISTFENLSTNATTVFNVSRQHRITNTVWKYGPMSDDANLKKQLYLTRAKRLVNELAVLAKGLGISMAEVLRVTCGYTGRIAGKGLAAFGGAMEEAGNDILNIPSLRPNIAQAKRQLKEEHAEGARQVNKAKQYLDPYYIPPYEE